METINEIFIAASKFRQAIELCDKSKIIETLHSFPNGSCTETTKLLARYLYEEGLGEYNYIVGQRNIQSHAWLSNGEIIIDITADQFEDQSQKVIVTKFSEWHNNFDGELLYDAEYLLRNKENMTYLKNSYEEILTIINT